MSFLKGKIELAWRTCISVGSSFHSVVAANENEWSSEVAEVLIVGGKVVQLVQAIFPIKMKTNNWNTAVTKWNDYLENH